MTNFSTTTQEEIQLLLEQFAKKIFQNNRDNSEKPIGIFDPLLINHTITEFCKNASQKINDAPRTWDSWVKKAKDEQHQIINKFLSLHHYQENLNPQGDTGIHYVFQFIKELHNFNQEIILKTINEWSSTEENRRKMHFFSKILLEAISPLNHPFVNPDILNTTIQEKGENFARGISKLIKSLTNSNNPILSPTLYKHNFKLGSNLACTEGFVVYQNKFCQLIYYKATQNNTYKTPLLIVPSWINKYYIFDLSPNNSMVRWCLDQGQDVFIISWVNPDKNYQYTTLDQYIIDGLLNSIQWMEKALEISCLNLMGYCVGGTIALCLISYLNQTKQNHRISSATLIATPIDFSYLDELSTFVCNEQIQSLENYVSQHGIIEGAHMRLLFSFLRSQDLIWPSIISNYFLGKEEEIIDFIFWNHDCINIPGPLHIEYLKNIFKKNALINQNSFRLGNKPIDISKIQQPIYIVGFEKDHIVPWRSSWQGLRFLPNAEFVLAGSGHVAGAINPPHNNKYGYKILSTSTNHKNSNEDYTGSWWNHWGNWVKNYSGPREKAKNFPQNYIIEKAPGSFAL
jgi:polyhydroxyalkanoate synthase